MIHPKQVQHDSIRCSIVSYVTEDSVDSAGLATPIDASPPAPPANTFPTINIVNDDPLPNIKSYPDVAYINRRRAQTSPRPVPSSIIIQSIPQQQPTMISSLEPKVSHRLGRFWPKIKRSMLFTQVSTNEQQDKQLQTKPKRWFHKNKVEPK